LLDLRKAAAEYGIPYWTLRGLVHTGAIPRVRLPRLPGADVQDQRRIWLDRRDLDDFVEQCKS
jgi:hypothetical protein